MLLVSQCFEPLRKLVLFMSPKDVSFVDTRIFITHIHFTKLLQLLMAI